jgi:hypothetical protein
MVDFDGRHIVIPIWNGVARQVAEVWRLEKDAHSAVCSVWTHPDGGELRLTVDGKLQQAEATHHFFLLPTLALAWQERWQWIKGWR